MTARLPTDTPTTNLSCPYCKYEGPHRNKGWRRCKSIHKQVQDLVLGVI